MESQEKDGFGGLGRLVSEVSDVSEVAGKLVSEVSDVSEVAEEEERFGGKKFRHRAWRGTAGER
jgi:hypothetical protein